MTTSKKNNDVDALAAEPSDLTLVSGTVVEVQRLRTRQLFKLMKIVTRGASAALEDMELPGADADTSDFTVKLLGAVIASIPEAEEETIEFLLSMVLPKGTIHKPRSKADLAHNRAIFDELTDELYNPEIEDTINLLTHIIETEAEDMQRLGKQLLQIIQTTTKSPAVSSSSPKTSES
jgi:hypothetical protein